MHTLKIEHPVADFETWRAAFERDPVGRQQSGVRGYRVYRPVGDPKYVIIDLDFDGAGAAQAFLESLQTLWARVAGLFGEAGGPKVTPRVQIALEIESKQY